MTTASVSGILLEKEILLESGTNELEILVFEIADFRFGINVAKVREVLPATELTNLPKAHRSVRGVFKLRNQVIPCVSLIEHLKIEPRGENSESTLILTDLNKQQTAFLVDQVERIHRLSWENILPLPGLVALAQTPVTALARCGDRLIVMLDFERIIEQVNESRAAAEAVPNPHDLPRQELRVVLADDSPTVRQAIGHTLRASGYSNVKFFENGAEAWRHIDAEFRRAQRVEDVADLVISDVEMPQIDGFHLTKRIKEHPELRRLPVLLYSSIVTPDNHKKGVAVGADAQVAKPELDRVVQLADELIIAVRRGTTASPSAPPTAAPAAAKPKPAAAPAAPPDAGRPAATSRAAAKADADLDGPTDERALRKTFQVELIGRVEHLRELIELAASAGPTAEVRNDLLRTLHTVKSAAMVVPVDVVAAKTHTLESLFASAQPDARDWPDSALRSYTDWLGAVAGAEGNFDALLRRAPELESPPVPAGATSA